MAATRLVKVHVTLGGLVAGTVGELPTELADLAIKSGAASAVETLDDRVAHTPSLQADDDGTVEHELPPVPEFAVQRDVTYPLPPISPAGLSAPPLTGPLAPPE